METVAQLQTEQVIIIEEWCWCGGATETLILASRTVPIVLQKSISIAVYYYRLWCLVMFCDRNHSQTRSLVMTWSTDYEPTTFSTSHEWKRWPMQEGYRTFQANERPRFCASVWMLAAAALSARAAVKMFVCKCALLNQQRLQSWTSFLDTGGPSTDFEGDSTVISDNPHVTRAYIVPGSGVHSVFSFLRVSVQATNCIILHICFLNCKELWFSCDIRESSDFSSYSLKILHAW